MTYSFTNTTTDQTYSVGGGAINYTFSNPTVYTSSSGVSCSDITLTYAIVSAPAFVVFTPSANTFTFNSSSASDVGTYNISYTATLSTGQSQTFYFRLVVSDPCLSATISPSSLVNQSYMVNYAAVAYTFPAFTVSPASCLVNYSLSN